VTAQDKISYGQQYSHTLGMGQPYFPRIQ
jgi:hypothetical protein